MDQHSHNFTAFTGPVDVGFGGTAVAGGATAATAAVPAASPRVRLVRWALEGSGWTVLRVVSDAIALLVAVLITFAWPGTDAGATLLLYPFVVLALFTGRGMYRPRLATSALDDVVHVASGVSVGIMLVVVAQVLVGGAASASTLVVTWLAGLAMASGCRMTTTAAQRSARRRGLVGRRALVVGAGVVGERVSRRLLESPEYGLQPIGYLDYDPPVSADRTLPVLGSPSDLDWITALTEARHVVLAFSSTSDRAFVPIIRRCEELGLSISVVPRMFDALNDRASYETLGGLPILGLDLTDPRGVPFQVKHVLDRVLAGTALLLAGPLLAGLALAVRLSSPGPVLFRQRRVGRDGRAFDLLKFRSMKLPDPAAEAFVLTDGSAPGGVEGTDRRTLIGRFLRRSSLDELPQLINVLKGDMSLVGPRPERPEFVERFREDVERYGERHRVKAGITGWAQVNGLRGQTSIADRAEWDNYYIEHWSLWLDVKILLLTVLAVFRQAE